MSFTPTNCQVAQAYHTSMYVWGLTLLEAWFYFPLAVELQPSHLRLYVRQRHNAPSSEGGVLTLSEVTEAST